MGTCFETEVQDDLEKVYFKNFFITFPGLVNKSIEFVIFPFKFRVLLRMSLMYSIVWKLKITYY